MRIGYVLASEEFGPSDLVAQAIRAEQAGFAGLWISDHYHPWIDAQGHSPFVWSMVGAIAQATDLPLGTGVTCPTMRIHPAIVAQAAATSALLLDGRFTPRADREVPPIPCQRQRARSGDPAGAAYDDARHNRRRGPQRARGGDPPRRARLDVTLFERAAEPGGAARSAEVTLPGFVHDRCAAFAPMAAASPALREPGTAFDHAVGIGPLRLNDHSEVVESLRLRVGPGRSRSHG